ncbi:MAG: family 10 glycosylhydrolase [Prolixibacteraceae bacterium]
MSLFLRKIFLTFLLSPILITIGNPANHRFGENEETFEKNQPELKRTEFRAVWVATINNIDWPSKPNLSVSDQKKEFLRLLDSFQKFNLNVVIFQVRAASDAFYQSKTEPWSHFLTGKQGRPPGPYYDPLAWAIEMCHQRGMELHAWFNPFRVRNLGYYPLEPNSFAAKHPQYVKEFDKKLFLDPGYPEVRMHVEEVIAEVARNYEVDAILLDDYFYPYPVDGKKFGDEMSFAKYGHEFYPKQIKAWRRENINDFISALHDSLKQINPKIKFGISPFGIWRNKSVDADGSPGLKGISSYDDLFADVRKWLKEGWLDYVIPQLYWEKGNHFGDFSSMVQWWSENSYGKPIYIGQALYKSTSEKKGWARPDEINEQINQLRTNEKVRGFAFYSASNIGKLSSKQAMSLFNNQLKDLAAIDDDRHSSIITGPVAVQLPGKTVIPVESEEQIKQDFKASLEDNPIAFRESWNSLSGIIPTVRRMIGSRVLTWKVQNPDTQIWIALVSFRKTRERKYLQTVDGFSKTTDFKISDQKWKELKGTQLLLVSRNIQNKTESNSDFFLLKRRRIKTTDNPFKPR